MINRIKISFPNWGYLNYQLILSYQNKRKSNKFDYNQLNSKFKLLDELLKQNCEIAHAVSQIIAGISLTPINDEQPFIDNPIEDISNFPLWSNQFATIYNIQSKKYEYIQPNIQKVLNIPPEKFTIEAMLGYDKENKYYHPEDCIIFSRYALLSYFVLVISGIPINEYRGYVRQIYRMRIPEYNKGEYFIVDKKTYLVGDSIDKKNRSFTKHLNIWTILDDVHLFQRVSLSFNKAGEKRESYLNKLVSILNARILGFSPKEIVILSYWSKYINRNSISKHLNNALHIDDFTPKKVSDLIYKLSGKIIMTYRRNVMEQDLTNKKPTTFVTKNALLYANKLGLLDFDDELIALICKLSMR